MSVNPNHYYVTNRTTLPDTGLFDLDWYIRKVFEAEQAIDNFVPPADTNVYGLHAETARLKRNLDLAKHALADHIINYRAHIDYTPEHYAELSLPKIQEAHEARVPVIEAWAREITSR